MIDQQGYKVKFINSETVLLKVVDIKFQNVHFFFLMEFFKAHK